jgi:4-hydroxybenzoate polyprenyltransferase
MRTGLVIVVAILVFAIGWRVGVLPWWAAFLLADCALFAYGVHRVLRDEDDDAHLDARRIKAREIFRARARRWAARRISAGAGSSSGENIS